MPTPERSRRTILTAGLTAAAATVAAVTTTPSPAPAAPAATPDPEQLLDSIADGFSRPARAPVMHTPAEQGLAYEDVTFPSRDGVPLEGWYIPAPGSGKLVIANHPMGFTRSGLPTHLEPWHSLWAPSGNGFEVNLIPDYRILHDAGYHVLAYDLRSHGLSGEGNGGLSSSGIFEARDVAGALAYARSRRDTRNLTIGLFSRCLGCSSTFAAMTQFPDAFRGVRCLVGPQPVTASVIMGKRLAALGLGDRLADFEQRIIARTGIGFGPRSPREWARNVRVPTLLYQVRGDVLTEPGDVQAMFDNLPVADKRLLWIDGTTARWDGYLEFQRRPEPMLDWFATHMS
ncbi:alpha/beta hydrolase [Catenuloplanes indicus]|uniref:Pimeloyl-ACP methyl ester carboxylesterase n=1 Tax=Catenuloplanes indicus TaxID=137267 RepID=A0AAE3VU51_9ACTN|nr:alpha/beta hydrolase [Catenuloplanes indicus]MDQ0363861.1 pimeloyl-ACP methyl ester carboxylesterase [Catenuloplanes indicus]